MSQTSFFLVVGQQQRGPFPVEQLLSEGLTPATLVWREGMANWQPAAQVAELSGLVAAYNGMSPGPVPAEPLIAQAVYPSGAMSYHAPGQMMPSDISSKKIIAGVMGILLGGWGVHRFILGDVAGGIIRLVITVVTCGLGGLIGLIEGIIYLTKTDADFYETYIVQRKGWF